MGSPGSSLATLRPDLADSLQEFDLEADQMGFIGLDIMKVAEVAAQAGAYGRIPIEQLLQTKDTARAPGSGYARGKYTFEPGSYACLENGFEETIDDRERNMYREYFDQELVSTQRARDQVLRNMEIRIAALLQNNATFVDTGVLAGTWSTHATATPIADVTAAQIRIWTATGLWPNAVQITREQLKHLKQCNEITDKMSGVRDVSLGLLSNTDIAQAFDTEFLFVAGSGKNTANEGQTAVLESVWDRTKAGVGRVAIRPNDFKDPCVGRVLHWGEDGSNIGGVLESYRDETVRGDVIRARMDTDEKLLYAEAWELITGVLA